MYIYVTTNICKLRFLINLHVYIYIWCVYVCVEREYMGRVKKEACLNQQRVDPNVSFQPYTNVSPALLPLLYKLEKWEQKILWWWSSWYIDIDDKFMMMALVCVPYACLCNLYVRRSWSLLNRLVRLQVGLILCVIGYAAFKWSPSVFIVKRN